MKARVFISCGQKIQNQDEVKFSKEIGKFIKQKGYEPVLSSEMQTLEGINECLIRKMKRADYYLFVDICREEVKGNNSIKYRGSLYTHQELAWAYLLELNKVIFLQQDMNGFKSEGLLAYWLNNPIKFEKLKLSDDLKKKISKKMTNFKWNPTYSRHFDINLDEKPKTFFIYEDHSGKMNQYIWKAAIHNKRNDKPARNCVAFLWKFNNKDSPDKANLKWAGRKESYSAFIRPNDYFGLDLFAINYMEPHKVYLHSDMDVFPRTPIISKKGSYLLTYRIYAEDFPMKEFTIKLDITGRWSTTAARLMRNEK